MLLRTLLEVNTPKETKRKVNGDIISITAHSITVSIPLTIWNIYGLDAVVSK